MKPVYLLAVGAWILAGCTNVGLAAAEPAAPGAARAATELAATGSAAPTAASTRPASALKAASSGAGERDDASRILDRLSADCAGAGAQRGAVALESREALASAAKGAGLAGGSLDALLAWPVDFAAGESVAMVWAGQMPNPAWTIAIDHDPVRVGDALVMSVRIDRPPPGRMVVQMIAHPCIFVRLAPGDPARIDARWIERR